MIHPRCQLS
ncbi:Protein of unknown function [Leuconostoc citreum LBAE E16]|nr:Protein of unknown function [Leuconostoc citreum LBAE E16]